MFLKAKEEFPKGNSSSLLICKDYLTASFNALPGLNAGTLLAAISISSPVCGLRPLRAARSRTSKLPNPISCTLSPCFKASKIESKTASTAFVASF